MTCERCGQEHPKCAAHKRNGDPCGQNRVPGLDKCYLHCGKQRQLARAEGQRNLALAEAAGSLADVVAHPIDNPLDALADLAAEAVALKNHFADLVAELGKQMAFVTGKIGVDGEGNLGLEQKLDARVALYERALDRAHKFLADWVRLGFEERKAALDDARALLVRTVLVGVLTELGHEIEAPATHDTLARWLPVLDGNPPPAITV